MIITISIFGGIYKHIMEDSEDDKSKYEYHYEVKVISNHTHQYEIGIPVPIITTNNHPYVGTMSSIMNHVEIVNGSGELGYQYIDEQHMFSINGTKNIHIIGHKEFRDATRIDFSDYHMGALSTGSDSYYSMYYFSEANTTVRCQINIYYRSYDDEGNLMASKDWNGDNVTLDSNEPWQWMRIEKS